MYSMNPGIGIGINPVNPAVYYPYRRRLQNKMHFDDTWDSKGCAKGRADYFGSGSERSNNNARVETSEYDTYGIASCSSSSSPPPGGHCYSRVSNQVRSTKIIRPSTEIESLTRLMRMPADDAIKFIQTHSDDFLLLISHGRIRNRPLNLLIQIIAVKLCAPTSLIEAQDALISMFTTQKYLHRILEYTNDLMETLHCRFNVIQPYCSPIEILEYLYVYYNFALLTMPNNISVMFLENVQSADRLMEEVRWCIESSRNVKALMEYMESFRRIEIPLTNLRQQLMQLQFTLQDKVVSLPNGTKAKAKTIASIGIAKETSSGTNIDNFMMGTKCFTYNNKQPETQLQFRCNAGNSLGSKTLRTILRLSTDGAILYLQKQFDTFSILISQEFIEDFDLSLLVKVLGDKLAKPTMHRQIQSKLITLITTRELLRKLSGHTHQLVIDMHAGLNKMPRCRCALKTLNHLFSFYNFALPHMEVTCMNDFQDNVYSAHILLQNFLLHGNHENLKVADLNGVQALEQLFASLKDILDSNSKLQNRFMRMVSVEEVRTPETPESASGQTKVLSLANVNLKTARRPIEQLIIQLKCNSSSSWSDTQDTYSTTEVVEQDQELTDDGSVVKTTENSKIAEPEGRGLSPKSKSSSSTPVEIPDLTFPSPRTSETSKELLPAASNDQELKSSSLGSSTLVAGFVKNLFFINHQEPEQNDKISGAKSNEYEARYLVNLYRHLILQNYRPSQITVLVMYLGQKLLLQEWIESEKGPCSSMRVDTVDTFDDDGCDIIILSLVRSNSDSDNTTGVLDSENRMCKALARARNGLYIIGNMTCHLNSKSELWPFIYYDLLGKHSIGEELKLQCQIHGDIYSIVAPEDFQVKSPDGGCSKRCDSSLPKCSHQCDKYCHVVDIDHVDYKCEILIDTYLRCGHVDQVPCFMVTTDKDKLKEVVCEAVCGAELKCGHSCEEKCHAEGLKEADHDKYMCRKPKDCHKKCEKNHPCPSNHVCSQNCPPCTELVDKVLPCGHTVMNVKCSTDTADLKCVHKCETKLGRKTSKKCVLS